MNARLIPTLCLGLSAFLLASGQGARCEEAGASPAAASAAAAEAFEPNRVLDVKIQLAPEDWEALRHEGRGLATTWTGGEGDLEYSSFKAQVTVDGQALKDVAVRKKGYLGSLSTVRPSLKIDFGKYVAGQTWRGLRRLTLNNDRQDPSHTHQVMCYALFRKAGCPAPRCSFAHVTVNGKDLGFYSHVEAIDQAFLAGHFPDGSGNLYEGQTADFSEGLLTKFQPKTNTQGQGPDRSDLARVVRALKTGDGGLQAALAKVVDLDAFLTFWAMEVITGHWDGYTGDRNNYYVYSDPKTGRVSFIPWGADGAFVGKHAFLPNCPDSVYAWSLLSNRLYNHPETRRLYHERLRALLDTVWNEEALLAEVDRIQALLSLDGQAMRAPRDFIASRKRLILEELSGDGPAWTDAPVTEPPRVAEPQPIRGTFAATWGSKDQFVPGQGLTLDLTQAGEGQQFTALLNAAGMNGDDDPNLKGTAAVGLYGLRSSGKNLFVGLYLMPSQVAAGTVPFHGFETFGVVVEHSLQTGQYKLLGFIGDGAITLTAAGTQPGDKVTGSFAGLFGRNPE